MSFTPSTFGVGNSALMFEGDGEDICYRICKVVPGGKSGEGKTPSFVKVRAIDGKNYLPPADADGEELEIVKGLKGKGPYTEKHTLKVEFYRTKGTTVWKFRKIEKTEDPEKREEWLKKV